jgi:hypothetical protein
MERTGLGYSILGSIKVRQHHSIDALVVGIGDNLARKAVFNQLKIAGAKLTTVVHPRATLGKGVALGEVAAIAHPLPLTKHSISWSMINSRDAWSYTQVNA